MKDSIGYKPQFYIRSSKEKVLTNFTNHLIIFIITAALIITITYFTESKGYYPWLLWLIICWGIIMLVHYMYTIFFK